jgi:hypothetical protein
MKKDTINIRVSVDTYNDLQELILAKRRRGEDVRIGELTDGSMREFFEKEMARIKKGKANESCC